MADHRTYAVEQTDSGNEWRVTRDVAGGWRFVYRVRREGATLLVTEAGVQSTVGVPSDGLATELIRALRLREVIAAVRTELDPDGRVFSGAARRIAGEVAGPTRGSRRRGDERLLMLAVTAFGYERALERGDQSPNQSVAAELGLGDDAFGAAVVRERVRAARREGILSPPPANRRAGGALTELGQKVIFRRFESAVRDAGLLKGLTPPYPEMELIGVQSRSARDLMAMLEMLEMLESVAREAVAKQKGSPK